MFLCDRNKKIVGPCQKLFDSLDNDPPFRPRSRRHNYPLVSGHHHPEHSFSESTCSGSPQTVILRYDMIGDQRLLSYAATDHRRHRSRSAAPGSGNRNKPHHHRSLSRSRPRSSSPRHRYQQLHQHQTTTAPTSGNNCTKNISATTLTQDELRCWLQVYFALQTFN